MNMRLKLSDLRSLIRETLSEYATVVVTASPGVDPTKHDDPPSLNLDKEAEKLHKGFYPYEIERGVPAPQPIIKSNKLGP